MFRLLIVLIVFVSQLGNDYHYDCGGASAAMIINYHTGLELDATDVMDMIGKDKYVNCNDLSRILSSLGLKIKWGDGIPRIVLIRGNHWVVYLGDGYYHDPLNGPYQKGFLGDGLYVEIVKNDNLGLLLR